MPPARGETVKQWNDRMAAKYDAERFHEHPRLGVRWLRQQRIRHVFRLLAPQGEPVLEVGCGVGYLLSHVRGRRVGLDLAETLLRKAARRLGSPRGLLQADAQELPFRDASWSRIYCSEVLEHLPSPWTALREMARVLAPGGRLVVSIPNERLIRRVKWTLRALGIWRLVVGSLAARYAQGPEMDDEWHWHVFDRRGFLAMTPPSLRVTRVGGIPVRWCPLQWIVCYEGMAGS